MKKALLLVIALFMLSLTVVYAQSRTIDQVKKEIKELQLQIEKQGGVPTPEQMQKLALLQQEAMALAMPGGQEKNLQQQQQQMVPKERQQDYQKMQQVRQYPGETRGWPPAAAFTKNNLPVIKQPAGTDVSYDGGPNNENDWFGFTIHLTGGNSQSVLQNLKQQVESATKRKMEMTRSDPFTQEYYIEIPFPGNGYKYYKYSTVTLGLLTIPGSISVVTFSVDWDGYFGVRSQM